MGWGSGSTLFSNLAIAISDIIKDEDDRHELYKAMIAEFESFDCDTLRDCTGIDSVLDEVLEELFGDDDDLDDEIEEDEWPDGGRENF